uniref:Uncharacterized protein n=1 Tax=viral metagenome TaxID=1070528 RepID=A0A6C0EFD3_9ZZZZ
MTKKYKDCFPVFRLKPINKKNECVIKHVGYVDKSQKLLDELMEIETPERMSDLYGKNVFYVGNINEYDIFARVYKCNIIGNYLVDNAKIPIYCLEFDYVKQIVRGKLFSLNFIFEFSEECKKTFTKASQYKNATAYGSFKIEIDIDKEFIDSFDTFLKNTREKQLKKYVAEIMLKGKTLETLTGEELVALETELDKKENFYKELVNGITIGIFSNEKSVIKNYFENIYKSPLLTEFLTETLYAREKSRRKQMNATDTYYESALKHKKLYEQNKLT